MAPKYVVFKYEDVVSRGQELMKYTNLLEHEIPGAVVIRLQDEFAAPALYAYANAMSVAIKHMPEGEERDRLIGVADYFSDAARKAENQEFKKLPD